MSDAPEEPDDITYDWVNLEHEERVIWEGRPHVYSLVPAVVVGIPLSILLVGLVIIAWAWVARENTSYVITSEAVYRKRGTLSRDVKRVDFEKIQNTSFRQGILGTHFDYGTVEISTAGSEGAEVRFRAVPDPRSVQKQLNERLERRRNGDSDRESAPDDTDLLRDIRDELRTIRTILEPEAADEE